MAGEVWAHEQLAAIHKAAVSNMNLCLINIVYILFKFLNSGNRVILFSKSFYGKSGYIHTCFFIIYKFTYQLTCSRPQAQSDHRMARSYNDIFKPADTADIRHAICGT